MEKPFWKDFSGKTHLKKAYLEVRETFIDEVYGAPSTYGGIAQCKEWWSACRCKAHTPGVARDDAELVYTVGIREA